VRIRPILLTCAATIAALALPAPAIAGSGGGATAPTADPAGGGGADAGGAVPAARKDAEPRAEKRRAAAERKAARRAGQRRAARRRKRTGRHRYVPAPVLPPGDHVFPVAGTYSLGGDDAGFGARRDGHRHQGHDLAAARGTAVVAPYAGVIDWVRFQRGGAGHYVVLDADDDRDYVFMHLRRGSIRVAEGQRVAAGDQIAEVGNSGRSFGAHLHFEVWIGGWFEKGGEPVDPLPLLEDWASP
jgi:murein DD-endopeptidase MepM/ murein hydrolase activator NlpD